LPHRGEAIARRSCPTSTYLLVTSASAPPPHRSNFLPANHPPQKFRFVLPQNPPCLGNKLYQKPNGCNTSQRNISEILIYNFALLQCYAKVFVRVLTTSQKILTTYASGSK
jgi:hypothetical protein